MTIERPRGRSTRTACGRSARGGWKGGDFFVSRCKAARGGGKKSLPGRCGKAIGAQPVPSARSAHQRTRPVGLVETEGRRQGGLTRHTTRALHWHRIGRVHVVAIDSIAGEKVRRPQSASMAPRSVSPERMRWRSTSPSITHDRICTAIYASLVETEVMRTPLPGLPQYQLTRERTDRSIQGRGGAIRRRAVRKARCFRCHWSPSACVADTLRSSASCTDARGSPAMSS
jgi:hypothetical protein